MMALNEEEEKRIRVVKALFFTPAAERPELLAGLSRSYTGDVAPQRSYSETLGFTRGAAQLVNF